MSYQWKKNGTVIAGATSSSYTTPPTISSDDGAQVTVVVSNTAGSVTSNAATLTLSPAQPPFGHVFVAVEENTDYSSVIGTTLMPYLNTLIAKYGLATQYYANTHPSIGNYFMLTAGQILTNNDGETPASFPVSVDNVVRELLLNGKTWKSYAENLPASVGYIGGNSVNYVVRHNPFPYFTDVQNNSTQRLNLVPFEDPDVGFAHDLANNQLPDYSFIVPNLCDDAHDCSLTVADNWLQAKISPLILSSGFQQDGLLVILFDESGMRQHKRRRSGRGSSYQPTVLQGRLSVHHALSGSKRSAPDARRPRGVKTRPVPGAAATAPTMWEFFTFPSPS